MKQVRSFFLLRYLGDFYELELQAASGARGWSIPETKGGGPSARESHAAVSYTGPGAPKLYVFGGMQGCRLNDLWQLDLGGPVVSIPTSSTGTSQEPSLSFSRFDGLVGRPGQRLASDSQEPPLSHCRWKQVRRFGAAGLRWPPL